jgi:transposase-like protein
MPNLASRIKEAIESAKGAGVSIADIAKACSVSVQSVYQWRKDGERQEIEGTKLVALAEITGYCSMWIVTGKGPKLCPTEEEWEVLRQYRLMKNHEQQKWRLLWSLAKDGKTDEDVSKFLPIAPKHNPRKIKQ